jgi:hypothetical protein
MRARCGLTISPLCENTRSTGAEVAGVQRTRLKSGTSLLCVHANYILERLVTVLSINVVQVLGKWHGTAGLFI